MGIKLRRCVRVDLGENVFSGFGDVGAKSITVAGRLYNSLHFSTG